MGLSILSADGLFFVLRMVHIFFGIVWIGHLYYFNFTQGPFFNETDAATKSNAIQKLVPRALWWFRWGAMWTFVLGWVIFIGLSHQNPGFLTTARGVLITIGGLIGSLMWFNVWFVIWPAQKVVIQNAVDTAAGKPANPEAAVRATRAGIASRTNVLFSIPMLFMMAASTHLPVAVMPEANLFALYALLTVILGALEFNAIKGKMGPMATIKGVVHLGFLLAIVIYVATEFLTK